MTSNNDELTLEQRGLHKLVFNFVKDTNCWRFGGPRAERPNEFDDECIRMYAHEADVVRYERCLKQWEIWNNKDEQSAAPERESSNLNNFPNGEQPPKAAPVAGSAKKTANATPVAEQNVKAPKATPVAGGNVNTSDATPLAGGKLPSPKAAPAVVSNAQDKPSDTPVSSALQGLDLLNKMLNRKKEKERLEKAEKERLDNEKLEQENAERVKLDEEDAEKARLEQEYAEGARQEEIKRKQAERKSKKESKERDEARKAAHEKAQREKIAQEQKQEKTRKNLAKKQTRPVFNEEPPAEGWENVTNPRRKPKNTPAGPTFTAQSFTPPAQGMSFKEQLNKPAPSAPPAPQNRNTGSGICTHTTTTSCECKIPWSLYNTREEGRVPTLIWAFNNYTDDPDKNLLFCHWAVEHSKGCTIPDCRGRHWKPEANEKSWMKPEGRAKLDLAKGLDVLPPHKDVNCKSKPHYRPRLMRDGSWCIGYNTFVEVLPTELAKLVEALPGNVRGQHRGGRDRGRGGYRGSNTHGGRGGHVGRGGSERGDALDEHTPVGHAPAGHTPAGRTPAGRTPAGRTPAGRTPAATWDRTKNRFEGLNASWEDDFSSDEDAPYGI